MTITSARYNRRVPHFEHSGHSRLATAGGFAAILLWSTTFAIARSISEQVGSFQAAGGIYAVSALMFAGTLIIVPRRRAQMRSLRWRPTLVCGALFVGYMIAVYMAIGLAADRAQTLVVALLNYLWPALTILLSLWLLRARAGVLLIPATILAIAGVYFVLAQGSDVSPGALAANLTANPVAYLLATFAAVAWALYSNLTRRWGSAGESGTVAAGVFLTCTAGVMILLAAFAREPGEWNGRAITEALFLGVANYFGYTLWEVAMRRGNLTLVAAASYFTPLLSTAISCIYLRVPPGTGLLVGCALLVTGSIMSWLSVSSGNSRKSEGVLADARDQAA